MPELQVRVKAASNLRDVQFIGKQDPFCELRLGGRVVRTRVHDNGGKNPRWDDTFVFTVMDPQVDQLLIFIKDSNWVSDEYIGTCQVPLNAFLHGQLVDQWYPVNHGRHQKGSINLAIQLFNNNMAGTYGAAPSYPMYPQQNYSSPYPAYQPTYAQAPPAYYAPPQFQAQPGYPGYAPPPAYPPSAYPSAPPAYPPPPQHYGQPTYPGYAPSQV